MSETNWSKNIIKWIQILNKTTFLEEQQVFVELDMIV